MSFPLLLQGGTSGGGNLNTLYGPYDNYVVVNKVGIVRYNASLTYAHGNRYHLNELRACIDSLVSNPLDVPGPAPARSFELRGAPNPFRTSASFELSNPRGREVEARITVHDLAGRRIATLWDGPAAPGVTTMTWDGRDAGGTVAPAGLYLVRGDVDGVRLTRRITRIR